MRRIHSGNKYRSSRGKRMFLPLFFLACILILSACSAAGEEPLKAAEVNGGLYMLFEDFTVTTLMGPRSLVGNRSGWTLEEMLEVFSTMPADSTVLRHQAARSQVFYKLLSPSLDQYVDWDTGECSFASQNFRNKEAA